MRYLTRNASAEKREKRLAVHRRWVEKNREAYLAQRRRYASRPEIQERRRWLYRHRNDPPPTRPITLDVWARERSARVGPPARKSAGRGVEMPSAPVEVVVLSPRWVDEITGKIRRATDKEKAAYVSAAHRSYDETQAEEKWTTGKELGWSARSSTTSP